MKFIATESAASPPLTYEKYEYDFGDAVGLTSLLKMYMLDRTHIPVPIHAGRLRYHEVAPTLSLLKQNKLVDLKAYEGFV